MTLTEDRPLVAGIPAPRRAMIDSQLRTSGVNDPAVLAAFARVAREDHVPDALKATCHIDRALPLGGGRYLAAPVVHGMMLAEAAPSDGDKALLISGGSTYLAALLRPMVGSLDVIDADDAAKAKGAFSLMVIDGAVEALPAALASALAEGGRVITGLVERGVTRLAAGRKVGGDLTLLPLAEVGMPVLPQFAVPNGWSF